MTNEAGRKAFEKCTDVHIDPDYVLHLEKLGSDHRRYLNNNTNAAWWAWQACDQHWRERLQSEAMVCSVRDAAEARLIVYSSEVDAGWIAPSSATVDVIARAVINAILEGKE